MKVGRLALRTLPSCFLTTGHAHSGKCRPSESALFGLYEISRECLLMPVGLLLQRLLLEVEHLHVDSQQELDISFVHPL